MVSMNRLSTAERARIVTCLVEGNSIRATVRMTGASKNTIAKLLVDLGAACSKYQDETIRNLQSKRVQCDEIWSFVGAKKKNVPEAKKDEWGDCWTWTAMDADTKLIISFRLGSRGIETAYNFMLDLSGRLASRVQLTTDGHKIYLDAVDTVFHEEIDYAMLSKIFTADGTGRYSPGTCIGCISKPITGNPDLKHISTAYVERQNLTMRMSMRRFTRLTNDDYLLDKSISLIYPCIHWRD